MIKSRIAQQVARFQDEIVWKEWGSSTVLFNSAVDPLYPNLIAEELQELRDARGEVQVLDALADIVYLCYGLAHQLGLPLDEALDEVHRSNMTKTQDYKDSSGKILKGPQYSPPELAAVLGIPKIAK